jgi:hypothetical protein
MRTLGDAGDHIGEEKRKETHRAVEKANLDVQDFLPFLVPL